MMIASKVSIRITDNYGSNDLTFTLRGSTKAINFVLPKIEFKTKLDAYKKLRKEEEKLDSLIKLKVSKLLKPLVKYKIEEHSLSSLKSRITNRIKLGDIYENIVIRPDGSFFKELKYIKIYGILSDGNEKRIQGTYKVEEGSALFQEVLEKENAEKEKEKLIASKKKAEEEKKIQKLKRDKDKIYSLLEKFKIGVLKDFIYEAVNEAQQFSYSPRWEFDQVKEIGAIFPTYKLNGAEKVKVLIRLDSGEVVSRDKYTFTLKVGKNN